MGFSLIYAVKVFIFVNSVYVMDNGIEIALNYKEGTKIITFDEMKKFYNEGSDLSPPARPKTIEN